MFRLCSKCSESVQIFSNVQNLFRIFSNVQNLFRIFSVMFRICSEFSVMFRICSEFSVMFRICSEYSVMFRICSEFSVMSLLIYIYIIEYGGHRGRDHLVVVFTTTYAISSGEVYSMQHYVIKFVSDLR
jgi:hypothetical protein